MIVLDAACAAPLQLAALAFSRWPALRVLVLGDVVVHLAPFAALLLSHPALRALGLFSRCGMLPAKLGALGGHSSALHALRAFAGPLAEPPPSPARSARGSTRSRTLNRSHSATRRRARSRGSCAALPALRALTVPLVLATSYDHIGALRALVGAAPGLEMLEFVYGEKPCCLRGLGRRPELVSRALGWRV
jgi:hypothetical protein